MILYWMQWEAVRKAKAMLPDVYTRYWTEPDNHWMLSEWGADAFVPFREVSDFSLTPPEGVEKKGELDVENCIRVYEALGTHLDPAEASEECLWAGICNWNFYAYMRSRWGYDHPDAAPTGKDAAALEARFFFPRQGGRGVFRNTLSKCWWIGFLLRDDSSQKNPYWRLQALGPSAFSTKVTDLFFNYGYSASPSVLDGILLGIKRARDAGLPIDSAQKCLRPALRLLNAVGSSLILDALPPKAIAEIVFQRARSAAEGTLES